MKHIQNIFLTLTFIFLISCSGGEEKKDPNDNFEAISSYDDIVGMWVISTDATALVEEYARNFFGIGNLNIETPIILNQYLYFSDDLKLSSYSIFEENIFVPTSCYLTLQEDNDVLPATNLLTSELLPDTFLIGNNEFSYSLSSDNSKLRVRGNNLTSVYTRSNITITSIRRNLCDIQIDDILPTIDNNFVDVNDISEASGLWTVTADISSIVEEEIRQQFNNPSFQLNEVIIANFYFQLNNNSTYSMFLRTLENPYINSDCYLESVDNEHIENLEGNLYLFNGELPFEAELEISSNGLRITDATGVSIYAESGISLAEIQSNICNVTNNTNFNKRDFSLENNDTFQSFFIKQLFH